jgi:murein DD-endopeptidase MepM/ murein hydrolase activator NlpD
MLRGFTSGTYADLSLETLAQEHRKDFPNVWNSKSPFLNAQLCEEAVRREHTRRGIAFSYGGYLENRSTLWHGSYLDADERFIHLGIDVNVPAHTPIFADSPGRVVSTATDHPEEHGWGMRVIMRLDTHPVYLVYGHLHPAVRVHVNDRVKRGTLLGIVGTAEHNGGWFPHVHVQAVAELTYHRLLIDGLRDLDGYGRTCERELLRAEYPNPLQYITIP